MAQKIRGFWFRLCGFFVGVFGTLFGNVHNARAAGAWLGDVNNYGTTNGESVMYTECQTYNCRHDEWESGERFYFYPQELFDFIMTFAYDDCVEKMSATLGNRAQAYCDSMVDFDSATSVFNRVYDIYWDGDGYAADGVYDANGNCNPCYYTTTRWVEVGGDSVPYFAVLEYMKKIDPRRINDLYYDASYLDEAVDDSDGALDYREYNYYVGEKMWLGFKDNGNNTRTPFVTSYGSVYYSLFRIIGCSTGRLSGAKVDDTVADLDGIECVGGGCPNVDDDNLLNLQYSMRDECYIDMNEIEEHNLYDATGYFYYKQPNTEMGNTCYCFENNYTVCS